MKVFITNIESLIKRSDVVKALTEQLSVQDKKRLAQMRSPKRAAEFLAGRFLLNKCFDGQVKVLVSGKIVAKDAYLSLSHSGKYAVFAVSKNKVGIDIEKMSLNRNFEKIALKMGLGVCENADAFYEKWTAFEADFKCDAQNKSLNHAFLKYEDYMICVASFEAETIELVEISA